MNLLEIIGALVLTGLSVWVTLSYLALMLISDESFFFGLKYHPVEWLVTTLGGLAVVALAWYGWWHFFASQISISIGAK